MQPIYHVELATPLPQDVQPCILLGRLVLDPHLKPSNLNLDGQLNPSPDRVGIEADIRREWHYDSHDVWTSKHSFVVGPARVWNALLAHEPSVQAIRKVAVDGSHGRLIVAVYTVNSIVTAVDYACVLFKEGKLVVNMKESVWNSFGTEPAASASWFGESPRATNAINIVGVGVGTAIATSLALSGFLGAVGLSAGGVVAGTIAAARWQVAVRKVIARAPFAGVQLVGGADAKAGESFSSSDAASGASAEKALQEEHLGVRILDM